MRDRFVRIAVFLTILAGSALAQSEVGGASLNGTVLDPTGAAVPNAKITVTNTATGLTRDTTASEAGLYSFSRLPVGPYDVNVEASGFKTEKRTGVNLSVGAVATLDISLSVGQTQEVVSVTAEVPIVETTRSQTSTTVTSEQVTDLPINGRNFLDFTVLTPGVVRDPSRGGDLSFGGQRGTANSLLVDGSDTNNVFFGQTTGRTGTGRNPYSFSQDAVQEFQVNTNGYQAEIGRAGGGVINVITKSGTNDFHGTAFWFFRDKAMNANSWEFNRRGAAKRAYHFNQFGGNIGGPVVKNRVFFFFNYDGQRNTTPNPVFLQVPPPADAASQQAAASLQQYLTPYSNQLNNDVYLAKVDLDINSNQRLSVRYNANRFKGVNFENTGSASAAEHTGNSDVSTDNIVGNHTWVIGSTSVLESRFGYTRDDEPGASNSTAPEAIIRQGGNNVLSIGRNSFSPRYTNAKTYQWVETYSRTIGRHALKFGSDMNFQQIGNFFPGNFSGSYTFNSYADFANRVPFSFTQAFAGANTSGPLTEPNVNEFAFFVQDSWRATERLTINYGVRYDFFDYAQPSVKNPDAALAALNLDTSRINLDHNNIAPRFGFAYKLNDAGSTVIRGGYGMFYGRTPSIMVGTAFSQNGVQVQTYTLNQTTGGLPTYPNVLSAPPAVNRRPDIFVFAPDYVQPLTHQWSFNIDQQLGRDWAVTLGYLGVRGTHLSRTRDINLGTPDPVTATFSDTNSSVTFLRYPAARPISTFGRIQIFDSGADSVYHGGFLQLSKRFSHGFLIQSSYTLSKVIDDNPDFTAVVVGADDAKMPQYSTIPNLDRGRGNADIRHRFVFSGLWQIGYGHSWSNGVLKALLSGYELSTITQVQSGRPFSVNVGGDPNNDGNTRTDRLPLLSRNTFEGARFASVDLRFTRDISILERVKLRLMFEAFNSLNRANYSSYLLSQYNYNATTRVFTPVTGFGTPSATSDPRILQLAAKFTF